MNHILIIEDNEDISLMLAEALTHVGYKVKSSYTGVDGINEIKNNAYDLILLDIMLPYKSGDEILKETREFSETPVIVINFSPLQTVHLVTCNGYFFMGILGFSLINYRQNDNISIIIQTKTN